MMTTIAENTVASVHYTGTFPDSGDEFDSSRNGDPLTFLVGHKGMIPGFEREIMGASAGDTRSFTLEPDESEPKVVLSSVSGITSKVTVSLTDVAVKHTPSMETEAPISSPSVDGICTSMVTTESLRTDCTHPVP